MKNQTSTFSLYPVSSLSSLSISAKSKGIRSVLTFIFCCKSTQRFSLPNYFLEDYSKQKLFSNSTFIFCLLFFLLYFLIFISFGFSFMVFLRKGLDLFLCLFILWLCECLFKDKHLV
ncbi:hypothetical protein ACP275_03G056500 [Erythranthe tilingii]